GEVAEADIVIWCTIGSQAWRLSEKSAVDKIRELHDGPLVLAVSRADLFRNETDRLKVAARLEREASATFSDIVFVRARRAAIAAADDDAAWRDAGGAALMASVQAVDVKPKRILPVNVIALPTAPISSTGQAETPRPAPASTAEAKGPSGETPAPAPGQDAVADLSAITSEPLTAAADVGDLLASVLEITGVKAAHVCDMSTNELVLSGEEPDRRSEIVNACSLLIGSSGGDDVLEATATGKAKFHLFRRLDKDQRLVLYAAFSKKSATVAAARLSIAALCEAWSKE
ncbi:MAG: hypothetical protein AAF360_05865, partial [Pseudomonadota bacterium]